VQTSNLTSEITYSSLHLSPLTTSVISWSEFLAADTEVLGSIPGISIVSEWQQVFDGVHSDSWPYMRSYLKENYRFRSRNLRLTTVGVPLRWPRDSPLSAKVGTKIHRQLPGRSVGIVRLGTKSHEIPRPPLLHSLFPTVLRKFLPFFSGNARTLNSATKFSF
jgi:hypothetical protein